VTPEERRAIKRLGEALERIATRCRDPIDPLAVMLGETLLAMLAATRPDDAGGAMEPLGAILSRVLGELRDDARQRDEAQLRFELGSDDAERSGP